MTGLQILALIGFGFVVLLLIGALIGRFLHDGTEDDQ